MAVPPLKRKAGELATAAAETVAATAKKPKVNASITSFFAAPKSSAAATSTTSDSTDVPPVSTFDREKWVSQLSKEVRELLAVEIAHLEDGWLSALKEEIVTEGFLELKRFLRREKDSGKTVYPPEAEIYSW